MYTTLGILFSLLGLVIGSFINAFSFRYNSGKSIMTRSICFSCGKEIYKRDLVPVFSYMFLRGRCRFCHSKISFQYPLVELFAGIIFLSIYFKYKYLVTFPSLFFEILILNFVFWSIFLFISIYDLKHKIVPNGGVYTMIIIGAITTYLNFNPVSLMIGLGLFIFFFLLWLLSKGRVIGFGDVKIILSMALFLNPAISLSGTFLSFWIGAIYSVIAIILQKIGLNLGGKKLTIKSEIPFVPFMFLGFYLTYIFGFDFLSLNVLLGL